MTPADVLDTFRGEARALDDALSGLDDAAWERPTRCTPWNVRELFGHVCVAIDRVPAMLAAPAPPAADTSAGEYYRPDERFSADTNSARIAVAQDRAADGAPDFTAVRQHVERLCRAEPADRVVRTRHGDTMLLTDFLLTRVVELTLHGLDIADALDRAPWLTPAGADAVLGLLLGPGHPKAAAQLGWEPAAFLRKATGRSPLTSAEAAQVDGLGIRWLTLG